jgi:hypothetical protein
MIGGNSVAGMAPPARGAAWHLPLAWVSRAGVRRPWRQIDPQWRQFGERMLKLRGELRRCPTGHVETNVVEF